MPLKNISRTSCLANASKASVNPTTFVSSGAQTVRVFWRNQSTGLHRQNGVRQWCCWRERTCRACRCSSRQWFSLVGMSPSWRSRNHGSRSCVSSSRPGTWRHLAWSNAWPFCAMRMKTSSLRSYRWVTASSKFAALQSKSKAMLPRRAALPFLNSFAMR